MTKEESREAEAPLAEFSALRAELLQRMATHWNIFALQLTSAGVIFSFAFSNPSRTGFLLIIPLTTYALSGRYLSNDIAMQNIGTYIMEDLGPRIPGGLPWEEWIRRRPPQARSLSWVNPLILSFPGVSVIALVWVFRYSWSGAHSLGGSHLLLELFWILGAIFTVLSSHLIGRMVARYWRQRRRKTIALRGRLDRLLKKSSQRTPRRVSR